MPLLGVKVGKIVSVERLELSTNGLKGHCSTVELHARNEAHSIMAVILSQRHALAISYYIITLQDFSRSTASCINLRTCLYRTALK